MQPLIEQHASIDAELVNALIMATPESWAAADMLVQRHELDGRETMTITISSPDGHRDLVGATDEIYEGLYKLSDLCRQYGRIWNVARYSAAMAADGNWTYSVKFEY